MVRPRSVVDAVEWNSIGDVGPGDVAVDVREDGGPDVYPASECSLDFGCVRGEDAVGDTIADGLQEWDRGIPADVGGPNLINDGE